MFSLLPRKAERAQEIAPWRHGHPLARMREEFESLFNRFFGTLPLAGELDFEHGWAMDVDETAKEVVVRAEAPGFEAKDFEVELRGNVLVIHGEQKEEKKEEKKNGKEKGEVIEKKYLRVDRMVTLPEYINREKMEATYRNGVLEVRVPKTAEAQGKRIEVKA